MNDGLIKDACEYKITTVVVEEDEQFEIWIANPKQDEDDSLHYEAMVDTMKVKVTI